MAAGVTIFDRILDGELPCHRIFENDLVLAFLDIQPLSYGHSLLIPKERGCEFLHQLSPRSASELGRVLPLVSRALVEVTGAQSYNVLQNNGSSAGQVVMHVHFHIIPRFDSSGLSVEWRAGALDTQRAAELTTQLRQQLKEATQ